MSFINRGFLSRTWTLINSACSRRCHGLLHQRTVSGAAVNRLTEDESQHRKTDREGRWKIYTSVGLVGITGGILLYKKRAQCEAAKQHWDECGQFNKKLPNYSLDEIAKHKTPENGIWVTFNHGVYDITKFAKYHPGGPKIMLAAGGSLEPFWELYGVHKSDNVAEMLEHMRIGNVNQDEVKKLNKAAAIDDPFVNDPKRHPALKVNSAKPYNAEPPPELLIDSYITPNELFFVRNHLSVPQVDIKSYRLQVSGLGIKKPLSFTINDLKKKFKVHTITASVQCGGNRRSEMSGVKQVKGLSWSTSAISNAQWTGVKLSDVLAYAGVKDNVAHIQFEGLDKDSTGTNYGASIPAETALDPNRDVLLAFEMNGKELPADHGYPIRVVVPGTVGARHVKWVGKIVASNEESKSHWQRNDYKQFHPSTDWDNADFSKAQSIQEYPVQSAICEPLPDSTIPHSDEVTVKGYAWSGGGRGINRVDVSIDGGKTWHSADLNKETQKLHKEWAWTLWETTVPVPKDNQGKLEIVCKAIDTAHNTQPSHADGIWNFRGLLNNAWHKVTVNVPKDDED